MDDDGLPIERLLELALYAPVGLALTLHDRLPGELRRRRQALENRVQLTRMIGQFVVQQGRAELARQAHQAREAREAQPPQPESAPVGHPTQTPQQSPTSSGANTDASTSSTAKPDVEDADTPTADRLPIAGYEALAAQHVVQRLGGLRPDELEAVRRFESTHRARRTVLAKIEQLQAHA